MFIILASGWGERGRILHQHVPIHFLNSNKEVCGNINGPLTISGSKCAGNFVRNCFEHTVLMKVAFNGVHWWDKVKHPGRVNLASQRERPCKKQCFCWKPTSVPFRYMHYECCTLCCISWNCIPRPPPLFFPVICTRFQLKKQRDLCVWSLHW